MIPSNQQSLSTEGIAVSIAQLWAWCGKHRRTVCYKPVMATQRIDPRFAEPIKAMIEEVPSFDNRMGARLWDFNNFTAQRIFPLKGC